MFGKESTAAGREAAAFRLYAKTAGRAAFGRQTFAYYLKMPRPARATDELEPGAAIWSEKQVLMS
jgi:hypothetical protein